MKTITPARIFAAAVAVSAFAGLASADTVNMSFTGVGHGNNVRVSFFGATSDVFAGQIQHNITSGTGQAAALVGPRTTFCADFEQHVSSSSSVFEVVAPAALLVRNVPLGAGKGDAIRAIYAANGSNAISSSATNDFSEAFQIAVWEILYDYNPALGASSLNLTSGNIAFRNTNNTALSSGVVNAYNGIISSIGSGALSNSVFALQSNQRQDQFVYGPGIIPTPGTGALALLGAGVMLRRRRPAR